MCSARAMRLLPMRKRMRARGPRCDFGIGRPIPISRTRHGDCEAWNPSIGSWTGSIVGGNPKLMLGAPWPLMSLVGGDCFSDRCDGLVCLHLQDRLAVFYRLLDRL